MTGLLWLAGGAALLAILARLLILGRRSRSAPSLGLAGGKLRPCPYAGNCLCTESRSTTVAPLSFSAASDAVWREARAAVETCGGKVHTTAETYLHATFTSPVFRFVDDLELRLDPGAGVIHVRSASRVGRFDLGANRRRVERLRRTFALRQPTEQS